MKLNKMDSHQKVAFMLVCDVVSELIGGNENTLLDYDYDTKEYKTAKQFLDQGHDNLKWVIYNEVMMRSDDSTLKHLRFAGESFIMERIEKRLVRCGY